MSADARALAALCALALVGCFPDYQVGDEGAGDMQYVDAASRKYSLRINGIDLNTSFSHDFEIDTWEVTVRRYQDWLDSGMPLPCEDGKTTCPLDDEPYGANMLWRPEWREYALRSHYQRFDNPTPDNPGTDPDPPDCDGPKDYGGNPARTTYELGVDDYPMTCVSWYQAVAFCAWDGKRLPTQAEWSWVRTAHGTAPDGYPWGGNLPDCDDSITNSDGNGCGFPVTAGTADGDVTVDGVHDLVGSVFEWVWDVDWNMVGPPTGEQPSFSGSVDNADPYTQHLRAGGSYIIGPTENSDLLPQLLPQTVGTFPGHHFYNDAGFRCARTVR